MFRLLFLLMLTSSLFAETSTKRKTIHASDSSFRIEMVSSYGGGTQHGVHTVHLIGVEEDLGDTNYTTLSSKQFPLFPHFSQIYTLKESKPSEHHTLYLALGWSSGGSGHESYSGWLIRKDHKQIDVIDRFELIKPRFYPPIAVDTRTLDILVTSDVSQKPVANTNSIDKPGDYVSFSILMANGENIDLRKRVSSPLTEKELKRWHVTVHHPFKPDALPGQQRIATIEVSPSGFTVK